MSCADPRWIVVAERAYASLLHLYPAAFRRRWGVEMRQGFRDRCREIGDGHRLPLAQALALFSDLMLGAGREQYGAFERATAMKRMLVVGLLFALGGMVLFHDRVASGTATVTEVAEGIWKTYQRRLDDRAWGQYSKAVAESLVAGTPDARDHALAALLFAARDSGRPGPRLARGQAAAMPQAAQLHWDKAIAGADPLALWLAVLDCPVAACDAQGALSRLVQREGHDASVALLELHLAVEADDTTRIERAFERLSRAGEATDFNAALLRGLATAGRSVKPPARLTDQYADAADPSSMTAFELGAGYSLAVATPSHRPLLGYCNPRSREGLARRDDCLLAATRLMETGTFLDHMFGARIALRYAADAAMLARVRQAIRDRQWQQQHLVRHREFQSDRGTERIVAAWMAGGSEMEVIRRMVLAEGEPLTAPAGFEVAAHDLDPGI